MPLATVGASSRVLRGQMHLGRSSGDRADIEGRSRGDRRGIEGRWARGGGRGEVGVTSPIATLFPRGVPYLCEKVPDVLSAPRRDTM